MPTNALTSQLEAVNVLLRVAGQATVQALTQSNLKSLDDAMDTLLEVQRVVLSIGWKFNTEHRYPLPRGVDLTVVVPGNVLTCDVLNTYNSTCDPVQRGSKLYDNLAHVYTFQQDFLANVIVFLEWEELPQPARHYIMVKAARVHQGRVFGSESADKYSGDDEAAAKLALEDYEAGVGDHNILYDSLSVATTLLYREDFPSPSTGFL